MELGVIGNSVAINELLKLLVKIKSKYWKLGRSVALTKGLPEDFKSSFYSLGNDMDRFLSTAKTLEVTNVEKSS